MLLKYAGVTNRAAAVLLNLYSGAAAGIPARKELGPGDSVVGWIEGPLALAQELRGLNNIMVDFTDDPGFVRDLLDYTAEVAIRYAPVQIETGAGTIGMSDAAACASL